MSTILCMRRVKPEIFQRLEKDIMALRAFVFDLKADFPVHIVEHEPPHISVEEATDVSLEQAWQVLHFMLTGDPWAGPRPASSLLTGRELGDDPDYAMSWLDAGEVREFHEHLQARSDEDLVAGFDGEAASRAEVYLAENGVDDDLIGFALESLDVLRRFLTVAVAEGEGIIVYMS